MNQRTQLDAIPEAPDISVETGVLSTRDSVTFKIRKSQRPAVIALLTFRDIHIFILIYTLF
jgi:hypothetical protein